MWLRSIRFDMLVSLGCCALLGFFAWHAWFGPRSLQHLDGLSGKLSTLSAELHVLEADKAALQQRVALMRPESVDPDMLEELARSSLGWVGSNEIVVRTSR